MKSEGQFLRPLHHTGCFGLHQRIGIGADNLGNAQCKLSSISSNPDLPKHRLPVVNKCDLDKHYVSLVEPRGNIIQSWKH